MEPIWTELYEAAKAALNPRRISEYVTCGEVAAAVLSNWVRSPRNGGSGEANIQGAGLQNAVRPLS